MSDEDSNPVRGELHVGELPVGSAEINAHRGATGHRDHGESPLAAQYLGRFDIPDAVVHLPDSQGCSQGQRAGFGEIRWRCDFEAGRVKPLRLGDPTPSILPKIDEPLIPRTLFVTDSDTTCHIEAMTCVNAAGSNPYRTQVRRKLGLLAQVLEHCVRIPADHVRATESADREHHDGRGEGHGGTAVGAVVGSGVHRQRALRGVCIESYELCRVPTKRKMVGSFPLDRSPGDCWRSEASGRLSNAQTLIP